MIIIFQVIFIHNSFGVSDSRPLSLFHFATIITGANKSSYCLEGQRLQPDNHWNCNLPVESSSMPITGCVDNIDHEVANCTDFSEADYWNAGEVTYTYSFRSYRTKSYFEAT